MPDRDITDRQMALLCDLSSLEEAGLIFAGATLLVDPGYDAGTMECEAPGVLTHKGVQKVQEFRRSGKTIFP